MAKIQTQSESREIPNNKIKKLRRGIRIKAMAKSISVTFQMKISMMGPTGGTVGNLKVRYPQEMKRKRRLI